MARMDVYPNPHAKGDAAVPFLLDVQSDVLSGLDSRVVIPLRRVDRFAQVGLPRNLAPVFDIDGIPCFMETPKLAAVPARILRQPVTSLASRHHEVMAALDFLFHGF